MFYVLNKDLEPIGVLDQTQGGQPFHDDVRRVQIAEESGKIWSDTLELSISSKGHLYDTVDTGYVLLTMGLNGRWYAYTIVDMDEDANDNGHSKRLMCFNKAIFDFNKTYVGAKKFKFGNSREIATYLMGGTGWRLEDIRRTFVSGEGNYEVTEGTAQQGLDEYIKTFDCEVDAYVEVSGGRITDKIIEIVDERGDDKGKRYVYGENIKSITRKKSRLDLTTKLFVYGGNDSKGNPVHIGTVNDGAKFIVSEENNDKYNNGGKWLEAILTNDKITNPKALLDWGRKELKTLSVPQYEYIVDLYADDLVELDLGDRVVVKDELMEPPLTVNARVIEYSHSQSNPSANQIVVGDFITITTNKPQWIVDLESKNNNALQEVLDKMPWRVELITPNGTDFSTQEERKVIIARVYRGDENITARIPKRAFMWQKIYADGTHDLEWEKAFSMAGNVINVGSDTANSTIQCRIANEVSSPIRMVAESDFEFFARIKLSDEFQDVNRGVQQYCHVFEDRNMILWSKTYTAKATNSAVTEADDAIGQSFVIIKTDLEGNVQGRHVFKWGGHGSQYGVEFEGNTPYIITPMYDDRTKETWICRVKFMVGTITNIRHGAVTKLRKYKARVSLDNDNGLLLTTRGLADKVVFEVYDWKDFKNAKKALKPLYTTNSASMGFGPKRTYQSSTVNGKYLYVTYGIDWAEGITTLCYDITSQSLVWRIDWDFSHGNTNQAHNHAEAETINYMKRGEDVFLIQGLVFRDPDATIATRRNELYIAREEQRLEHMPEDSTSIDDESSEE